MTDRIQVWVTKSPESEPMRAVVVPSPTFQLEARLTETTEVHIICKFCGSADTIRYGFQDGNQQYWCKGCERKFTANNNLPRMRYAPEQIAHAVNSFYEGMSLNAIRRSLTDPAGGNPSDSTIYEWVVRFTEQATRALKDVKGDVGRIWVVDETVLQIDGKDAWFWDIITEETRFLVASHLTATRTTKHAETLFRRAIRHITRVPLQIQTDGLNVYIEAIENVFGRATKHIPSKGFAKRPNTNLIERFHSAIKQRTKVMRGFETIETARIVMDGWLLQYNYFRPHETLGGRTPAEAAGITFPYKSWLDVVSDDHIPTERRVTVIKTPTNF